MRSSQAASRNSTPCGRSGWLAFLAVCAGACAPASAENWPGWRGPRGDGSSAEKCVPTVWNGSKGEHIAWKAAIPGKGHASPIVHGDRVFVVSCREDSGDRVLLCLDRNSGRVLWEQVVVNAPLERKHGLNSHASSTPATDGTLVFTAFAAMDAAGIESRRADSSKKPGGDACDMVVAAHDFDGRRQWIARPGKFSSRHGFCSSPVLFENLVIVNGDHDGDAYLLALDRGTGKTVWKVPRENKTRSYCVPIVRRIGDRTQMLLSGSLCVASYDPRTGSRHWIIDGPTEQYVASLVYNGELVFLTAGFPEYHIMGIRPDGTGNVTATHVAWHTQKGCAYVPSPILGGGGKYFLLVSDGGIASCFEAKTGKRHWMERIGTHFSASAVEADGLVYFLSDGGATTIIRPDQTFDVVRVNELGENCYASPAISGGRIFIRAHGSLYCIGP